MKEALIKPAPEAEQAPRFDTQVTFRDHLGRVVKKNPYVLRVIAGPNGGKTELYERPVGSGNIFDGQGRPFGRWVDGTHKEKEAHVAFTPPETDDQKLARTLVEQERKIEQLQKELAAIKAEEKPAKAEKKN